IGLPFDGIRIADGYVRGVERDRTKHAAVASVIHFAHLLGAQVLAGDVEDPAQLRVLQELDCDLVEGPLLDPDGPQPSLPRGDRPGRTTDLRPPDLSYRESSSLAAEART
ncbi:EAL domain-containing protein, partial [Candidatus Frankia alpina]|uniref:EAL domain-containing protein n=1 Tax=Candidatus Frankia alpina TaxID=2699483 RepID=UPI00138703D3